MKEMKRERERFENSMGWLIFYWEIAIGVHYYWNWSDNRRCSAMRVLSSCCVCLCVLCVCRTTILNLTIHCSVVGVVLSQRADKERLCLLILLLLQCSFYVFFLSLSVSYSYSLPFSWFNINLASFSIVLLSLCIFESLHSRIIHFHVPSNLLYYETEQTLRHGFLFFFFPMKMLWKEQLFWAEVRKKCVRVDEEEKKGSKKKRTKRTPIICSNDIRAQLEISYTFGWMALFCLSIPCVAKHTCASVCACVWVISLFFIASLFIVIYWNRLCECRALNRMAFERTKNLNGSFDGKAPPAPPHLILEPQMHTKHWNTHAHSYQ